MKKKVAKIFFALLVIFVITTSVSYAVTYRYDEMNRVVEVTYDNGEKVTYEYDAAGNITKVSNGSTLVELVSISFEEKEHGLKMGDQVQLAITGFYSDGNTLPLMDGIQYSSSSSSVASVNENGLVKAKKPGTALITAQYQECKAYTKISVEAIPLNTPTDLEAVEVKDTTVKIQWQAPLELDQVKGYYLYRDDVRIAIVASTSYTDTGLESGETYTYTVSAYYELDTESDRSNAVVVQMIVDQTAPFAPENLRVTQNTGKEITVEWDVPEDDIGVVRYLVMRDGVVVATVSEPVFKDVGLKSGTTYKYTVIALDAAGNQSAPSDPLSVTAKKDKQSPTVPKGLKAVTKTDTSISLSWKASKDNVDVAGYRIYRNRKLIAEITDTEYTDTGLKPSSQYRYTVRAIDSNGNVSKNSSALKVRTAKDAEAPTEVSDLAGDMSGKKAVKLTWSSSQDNVKVVGYYVYRNGARVGTAKNKTTFTVKNLKRGRTYAFTVRAYDKDGNVSDESNVVTITIP